MEHLKKRAWHKETELLRYEYPLDVEPDVNGWVEIGQHVLCSNCVEKAIVDPRKNGDVVTCGHHFAAECEICGKSGFELDPGFKGASSELIDTAINGDYEDRMYAYSQLIDYAKRPKK